MRSSLLVVLRLQAGSAQDGLAQPLEAEDHKENAHENAQVVDRDVVHERRAEHAHDCRERDQRRKDTNKISPPIVGEAYCEDDRQ